MARQLVSEQTIRDLIARGEKRLEIEPSTIVTPAAKDLAASRGISVATRTAPAKGLPGSTEAAVGETGNSTTAGAGTVVFGSDHGGYQIKMMLLKFASSLGYVTKDLGTSNEEPCDYPDFAYAVARSVSSGEAWRGIMIDGAGIGSCVVANKVPGVRAACCHNEFVARNAREHNDTNVLTLGSRVTGSEVCKEILRIWLETPFSGGRHKARVDKITDVERKFAR